MRVNIEDDLRLSGRLAKLARIMGWSEREALGSLALFWRATQSSEIVDASEAELLAVMSVDYDSDDEAKSFIQGMLKAQLLSQLDDGRLHINGNARHVERLATLRDNAKKGGEARHKKAQQLHEAERQPGGKPQASNADPFRSAPSSPLPTPRSLLQAGTKATEEGRSQNSQREEALTRTASPSAPAVSLPQIFSGNAAHERATPGRKPRAKSSPEELERSRLVRTTWCNCYAEFYNGTAYAWGKKENGATKNLLGTYSAERLCELIERFFQWKNSEIIREGHVFVGGYASFYAKLRRLEADEARPDRHKLAGAAQHHARQQEQAGALDNVAEEAKRILANRLKGEAHENA